MKKSNKPADVRERLRAARVEAQQLVSKGYGITIPHSTVEDVRDSVEPTRSWVEV